MGQKRQFGTLSNRSGFQLFHSGFPHTDGLSLYPGISGHAMAVYAAGHSGKLPILHQHRSSAISACDEFQGSTFPSRIGNNTAADATGEMQL
jgi:hypothetical protein